MKPTKSKKEEEFVENVFFFHNSRKYIGLWRVKKNWDRN